MLNSSTTLRGTSVKKRFKTFDDIIHYWGTVDAGMAETLCFLASRMKTMAEESGFCYDWDTIPDEEDASA